MSFSRRRTLASILLLAALLACSACEAVLSTAQLPAIREDRMLGQWKDLGTPGSTPDKDPMVIRFMDGSYWAGSADDFTNGKATRFTVARIGGMLIAQSFSENDCDEFSNQKGQPCFRLNRVDISGDRMSWYDFDAQRLGR